MRHRRLRPGPRPPHGRRLPGFDSACLGALVRALAHRGPDGAGQTMVGRVALVHTRLAIIDLDGGDQPLFAGPAALVANGEIYNDLALRREFAEMRLATGSDCEPPLHLWLRDGQRYVERLRGMYAIAIHERGTHALTLSRDRSASSRSTYRRPSRTAAWRSPPSRRPCWPPGLAERGRCSPAARDELLQLQFTTGARHHLPRYPAACCPARPLRIADGRVVDRSSAAGACPSGPPEDDRRGSGRLGAARPRRSSRAVALHQRSRRAVWHVPLGRRRQRRGAAR